MPYEHRPDRGTLFPNTDKITPQHPDYTGKYALPDGTVRRISAWNQESRKGQHYLSLSFADVGKSDVD